MDNMKKILKKMPKVMKKSFKKSNTHDVLLEQANRMVINDNNLYLNNKWFSKSLKWCMDILELNYNVSKSLGWIRPSYSRKPDIMLRSVAVSYTHLKYKIWRKDGSYIGETEANLSTFITKYDSAFSFGPHIISSKVIDNKIKEEISIDFVAAIEKPLEKVKIRHALAGKYIDGTKEIKKEGVVNLSNENYIHLNKKIKID